MTQDDTNHEGGNSVQTGELIGQTGDLTMSQNPDFQDDLSRFQAANTIVEQHLGSLYALPHVADVEAEIRADTEFGRSVGIIADMAEKYAKSDPNTPVYQNIYAPAGIELEHITDLLDHAAERDRASKIAQTVRAREAKEKQQEIAGITFQIDSWQQNNYIFS